jgi:hypothetical protein
MLVQRDTHCQIIITIAVSIPGAEDVVLIAPELAWTSKLFLVEWKREIFLKWLKEPVIIRSELV